MVPSKQHLQSERLASPGLLGCVAVLFAVFACAFAFSATARADDSPAPVSPDATASDTPTSTDPGTSDSGASTTGTDTPAVRPEDSPSTSDPTTTETTTPPPDPSNTVTDGSTVPDPNAGSGDESNPATANPEVPTEPTPPPTTETPTAGPVENQPTGTQTPTTTPPDPGPSVTVETIPPYEDTVGAPHRSAGGNDGGVSLLGDVRASSGIVAVPTPGTILVMRKTLGCEDISLCGLVALVTADSASRTLFFQTSLGLDRGGKPGGGASPSGGGRPSKPVPPAPDREPHGPGAPGALTGFTSSTGFQGGALFAIILALLWLVPPQRRLRVAPFAPRRQSVSLVLSLERPG